MKATPSKNNDDSEERLKRKVFQQIALFGSAILLEKLVPKEKIEDFHCFNRDNAKSFLLARLLIEVQKLGMALKRWNEFLDFNPELSENSVLAEQNLDSLIDEQSLWQRKLVEGLVLLINFEKTNTHNHYHHFLLLHELEEYKKMLKEQKEFFSHPNSLTQKTVELLAERIAHIEIEIGANEGYWYINGNKPTKGNRAKLTSFKEQLKNALSVATPRERTSLCYTYKNSYSETSSNIHFAPLRLDYMNLSARFSFGISQCGMLTIAILRRVHELSGIHPEGINTQLMKLTFDKYSDNNPTIQKLEIGDFVFVDGPFLGEILSLTKSDFGYESYLVQYLIDSPIDDIDKAWFPSTEIQLFMRRKEHNDDLIAQLKKYAHEEGAEPLLFSDEELEIAAKEAVMEMWKLGLGRYYKQNTVAKRNGYRGLGYQVD